LDNRARLQPFQRPAAPSYHLIRQPGGPKSLENFDPARKTGGVFCAFRLCVDSFPFSSHFGCQWGPDKKITGGIGFASEATVFLAGWIARHPLLLVNTEKNRAYYSPEDTKEKG